MVDLSSGREVVIVNKKSTKSQKEEEEEQSLFFKNDEAKLVGIETKDLKSSIKCIKNVVSKSNYEKNCVIIKIKLVTKVSLGCSDRS